MAVKDYKKDYVGIRGTGAVPVPNEVSRDMTVGDKALTSVIWQSGKAILDSELEMHQDAAWWESFLLRRWQIPSGWLRGQTRYDSYEDFVLVTAPVGLVDDSGGGSVGGGHIDGTTLVNAVVMPRVEAIVAGYPVVVEYTNTRTTGYNLIALEAPPYFTPDTVKRSDFLFLEVWLALVAPSPKASGSIHVVSAADITAGDSITIGGLPNTITAILTPPVVPGTFLVNPADNAVTAANIVSAINDPANPFSVYVTARSSLDVVIIDSVMPGIGDMGPPPSGNFIGLSVTTVVPGALTPSGMTLTGGDDRPNKPDPQDQLFRHGNVLSPAPVWLPDEIVDSVVNLETTQRVQVQYRIRVATHQALNYKAHPDGFSNRIAAGSISDIWDDTPLITAQGARPSPTPDSVGGRAYPFVPADKQTIWLESSAPAYALEDSGLWIAGNGSEQSVQDLGTLDGFVYAIPIGYVFRHCDVSSAPAATKGFDPKLNSNGAPLHNHGGYTSMMGVVPPTVSDRPDGEFADVITFYNLLDLRRSVIFPGIDPASELQYQIQSLLDGNNRTWAVDSFSRYGYGGGENGDVSTRYLICNSIGRSPGPHDGATHIRDFDHICRRFGSQPVVERVVFAFWPGDRDSAPATAPGLVNEGKYVEKAGGSPAGDWYEGDILHLNFALLNSTGLGCLFHGGPDAYVLPGGVIPCTDPMPPGTVISDVLSVYHDDGHYTTAVDQRVQVALIKGLGTPHLEVVLDANDFRMNGGKPVADYHVVGRSGLADPFSQRRIFLEVEVSYPIGSADYHGTTDTPMYPITPNPVFYNGTFVNPTIGPYLAGNGPAVVGFKDQVMSDAENRLAPRFRSGFREIQLDYVTNTSEDPLTPAFGDPVEEDSTILEPLRGVVSRDTRILYLPRRFYGFGNYNAQVWDAVDTLQRTVDIGQTEYGSSSRKIVLENGSIGSALSGPGQTLCNVHYWPQDPIPNYGDQGYEVMVYFRATAPQTAGVMEGWIDTGHDDGGTLPTTLRLEPMHISPSTWTAQTGMGSVDAAFPYAAPMDPIAIMEGGPTLGVGPDPFPSYEEWYFCASANVTIDDFNADTGMLVLQTMVQADEQQNWELGGDNNFQYPRRDAEFRALYPYVLSAGYRPTAMAQPLFGSTRHKVFIPMLARVMETTIGCFGGILFRKNEVVLVVLSRTASLDDDNTIRFIGGLDLPPGDPRKAQEYQNAIDNRTCAAVYRTRNLLLVAGR